MTAGDDDDPASDPAAPGTNPRDFLRALLHIDPKDAEQARQDSPATRKPKGQDGSSHDYGEDK